MAEQRRLEKRYEELVEERANMKGMVNKSRYKEVQEEIQDISRALRESTNNLVRGLKENPNVSGNMIKVQRDRTELSDVLLRCIQELRDRGLYNTILHKVEDDNNARIRFQQLKAREKELRETVTKLQEQLNEEQRIFNRTSSEQRQAITQLKDELQSLKSSTSVDSKFKRKESAATVSSIWREFKHREKKLETRLKELEDKIHTENLVHGETKDFLVRKFSTLGDSIGRWESKYDRDVGELDTEIKNMTAQRSVLLEKLAVLQERKKKEIDENNRQRENEAIAAEVARQQKELEKAQNRAARTIQKEMRSFVKRKKELEAIKNEGKKKKGGDKKGKKGKK